MSSDQPWTAEQHRDFALAIYEAGIRSASPAVILHNMQPTNETITSERVKSHLQKYRGNRAKAKAEFIAAYDKWMAKAISLTSELNRPLGGNVDELPARNPAAVAELRELMNPANQSLGEMAASLGFLVMVQGKRRRAVERVGSASLPAGDNLTTRHNVPLKPTATSNRRLLSYLDYKSVSFPQLTREEMDSPLGQGLEYTRRLLSKLSSHLESQRHQQLHLNPRRLRSGQKILMASEKQHAHPAWGKPPTRRGQSLQRDSPPGWNSSAMGSGDGRGDKDNADSTSGESISPQTSKLLEAVAQASAAMQPTWLPVEGGTRHQMHRNHHRSHSEKAETAGCDENWSHNYEDDISPASLRLSVEEHVMREEVDKEREPHRRGNIKESTQLDDALVGDRRTPEYGTREFHQHDASETDWSHGIQPHSTWEQEKEMHSSLPSAEANLPWQSRNRHTNVLNEERRRQTNEVMSYRRGDPQQGGDTHAPAAPDSTHPWGAPPYT
jgi:SHAQKYF class myb-like DNA-binding protein